MPSDYRHADGDSGVTAQWSARRPDLALGCPPTPRRRLARLDGKRPSGAALVFDHDRALGAHTAGWYGHLRRGAQHMGANLVERKVHKSRRNLGLLPKIAGNALCRKDRLLERRRIMPDTHRRSRFHFRSAHEVSLQSMPQNDVLCATRQENCALRRAQLTTIMIVAATFCQSNWLIIRYAQPVESSLTEVLYLPAQRGWLQVRSMVLRSFA
jgi:hypothetical protein